MNNKITEQEFMELIKNLRYAIMLQAIKDVCDYKKHHQTRYRSDDLSNYRSAIAYLKNELPCDLIPISFDEVMERLKQQKWRLRINEN